MGQLLNIKYHTSHIIITILHNKSPMGGLLVQSLQLSSVADDGV